MNLSITNVICIITFFISYQAFSNRELFNNLKHYPVAESRNKEWYRFITSGFVHGSWIHLLINIFVLWSFGNVIENYFISYFKGVTGNPAIGGMVYTAMYLLALIVADIPSYLKHKNNPGYSAIGASGAVSAVVFINTLFTPWSCLYLYALVPIPYIIAAIAYVVYSSWASKNRNDNIGHDAHLYGALFGIVFTLIAIPPIKSIFIDGLMVGPSWPC